MNPVTNQRTYFDNTVRVFFFITMALACFSHETMTTDVLCIHHLLFSKGSKQDFLFHFKLYLMFLSFFFKKMSIKPWLNKAPPQRHGPSQLQSNLLFNFNSRVTHNSKSWITGEREALHPDPKKECKATVVFSGFI